SALSENVAIGDWRLFFLYRDQLRKVTLADVQRVAEHYLKPANRVIGQFVPTEQPQRADIPKAPDPQKALANYTGGDNVRLGEAFDPSPKNIESRLQRRSLSNGVTADGVSIEVRGANLIPALRLAAEALREPSFPPSEFDELKRAVLTHTEGQLSDPGANAEIRLSRHLEVYPPGHRNYTPTLPERISWIRKTTLKDAQRCYHELVGATGSDFAAVGEFDADQLARAVDELFGGWKSPHPFTRVPSR